MKKLSLHRPKLTLPANQELAAPKPPSRPILTIPKKVAVAAPRMVVDMQNYLSQKSMMAEHFGMEGISFAPAIPGAWIAGLLRDYCDNVRLTAPSSGSKRRRTGSKDLLCQLISKIYEIGYFLPRDESEKHFLRVFKVGYRVALSQNANVHLVDQKKMSAWAIACEALFDMNTTPDRFFDVLERSGGLEKLRERRSTRGTVKADQH